MRTTSSVEAMNSVIQRTFPEQTQIFKFVNSLRMFESIKSTDLYQISRGYFTNQHLQRKRAEDRKREEKIKTLSTLLNNETISVPQFLESMSANDVLPPNGTYKDDF